MLPPAPKRLEPTAEPDPAQGGGGRGYALETRLDLKGLLPGAVSVFQRARLSHPPPRNQKAPEESGVLTRLGSAKGTREPLHTGASTTRRHLCFQGAGPPPGVQRGGRSRKTKSGRRSLRALAPAWKKCRGRSG